MPFLTKDEVRKIRESNNYSQEEFATFLGIGTGELYGIENGLKRQSITLDNLIRLLGIGNNILILKSPTLIIKPLSFYKIKEFKLNAYKKWFKVIETYSGLDRVKELFGIDEPEKFIKDLVFLGLENLETFSEARIVNTLNHFVKMFGTESKTKK